MKFERYGSAEPARPHASRSSSPDLDKGPAPQEIFNEIRAPRVAGGVRARAACVRTGLL